MMDEFRQSLESGFALNQADDNDVHELHHSFGSDLTPIDTADPALFQDALGLCRRIQQRVDLSRLYHHRRHFPGFRLTGRGVN